MILFSNESIEECLRKSAVLEWVARLNRRITQRLSANIPQNGYDTLGTLILIIALGNT